MKRWMIAIAAVLVLLCSAAVAQPQACVTVSSQADDLPHDALYEAPSDESPVTAWFFSGVPMEITDSGSGYHRVKSGSLAGWMKDSDLALDPETADLSQAGAAGRVWDVGSSRYQSLCRDMGDEQPFALLEAGAALRVLCVMADENSLQVMLPDGTVGFTEITAVRRDAHWQMTVQSSNAKLRLNLRSKPDTASASLGQYYSGVPVSRLFCGIETPNWTHVAIGGVVGWMRTEYLVLGENDALWEQWPPTAQLQRDLNLRSKPSSDADLIASYGAGERAEVLGISGMWAHVALRDGNCGYMLLEGLGGEPPYADLSRRKILTGCTVKNDSGAVIGALYAGDSADVVGPRPIACWRYRDGAMVLYTPELVQVSTEKGFGYVPAEAIDLGF